MHYLNRPKVLGKRAFAKAAADCAKVCDRLQAEHGFKLAYEYDKPGSSPVFNGERIWFNGVGEEGHETFGVIRNDERDSDFCKTNRKPYDCAVCACLIVLRHHFPKVSVSSDGEDTTEGWVRARNMCQEVLGYGGDFTLKTITRFVAGGMKLDKEWRRYSGDPYAYRSFPNGWTCQRYDRRYLRRHTPGSLPFRLHRGLGEPMLSHESVANVQWFATCLYLREEFRDVPDADAFITAAAASPREWVPLFAWADRLDELDHPAGKRLRAHLPRLAGVKA